MKDFEILFVDDDSAIRALVEAYLSREGYKIFLAENGIEALKLLKKKNFDIVFTDFKMPEIDGLELLSRIKEYRPEIEVIIATGHGTMAAAVKAMKIGSYDFLQKPFKLELLKIIINRIIDEKKIKQENAFIKKRIRERHKYDAMVGINLMMQEIYEIIDRMKQHSPNVLIQGESGTGKELTAHAIHKNSDRDDKPFTLVNCSSFTKKLPKTKHHDSLIELLKTSEGGTVFLDEVTEISPPIQIEFLHALKQKSKESDINYKKSFLDVRIIAATNKDPKEALENGSLKRDFFNCINAVSIKMPPLRDRKEDIPLLIINFLDKFESKGGKKILNVSTEAMDYLLLYNWPGNVIQLENVIERSFAMGVDMTIQVKDLPGDIKTFGEISKIH